MTAPTYGTAPQAPAYPQPPAYGPQYPGQAPPQYPPASYPQPQQPIYQTPQYGAPQQVQQPAQPLAQGSLDDFYNQPSAGGGKSLAFKGVGQTFAGAVTRPVTAADVQQQTDTMGRPQTFRDGRPKFVMKVPLQMQPSPDHPDGLGTWYVKGQARDELVRAMAEAGAPAGAPESGAVIQITYTGDRQSGAGMNPAKQFAVVYQRPNGAPAQPAQFAPQVERADDGYAPPVATQAAPQPSAPAPQPPQAAAPAAPAPAAQAAPPGMTPEQQALLAQLAGRS